MKSDVTGLVSQSVSMGPLWTPSWTSQVAQLIKNLPANAGNTRDASPIPGSGRSSGGGNGNQLRTLSREIPCTEEPDGLLSTGLRRVRHV